MKAERILETCLYVDDLVAAEVFYRRVLGLTVQSRREGRHVFFRCGAGMLLLFDPKATQQPHDRRLSHGAGGQGHVAFAVGLGELPGWREQLHREGVEIEGEIDWPGGGHSVYFRDPAENLVELATPGTWGMTDPEPGRSL